MTINRNTHESTRDMKKQHTVERVTRVEFKFEIEKHWQPSVDDFSATHELITEIVSALSECDAIENERALIENGWGINLFDTDARTVRAFVCSLRTDERAFMNVSHKQPQTGCVEQQLCDLVMRVKCALVDYGECGVTYVTPVVTEYSVTLVDVVSGDHDREVNEAEFVYCTHCQGERVTNNGDFVCDHCVDEIEQSRVRDNWHTEIDDKLEAKGDERAFGTKPWHGVERPDVSLTDEEREQLTRSTTIDGVVVPTPITQSALALCSCCGNALCSHEEKRGDVCDRCDEETERAYNEHLARFDNDPQYRGHATKNALRRGC